MNLKVEWHLMFRKFHGKSFHNLGAFGINDIFIIRCCTLSKEHACRCTPYHIDGTESSSSPL